jgi:membrane associated rhomboid family serine protease
MTMAPVGIRCPDHSGKPRGAAKLTHGARRWTYEGTGSIVTKALIGANLLVYLLEIANGGTLNGPGVLFLYRWGVYGPGIASGRWFQLVTGGFLHGGLLHIGLNMLILWLVGSQIEEALGRGRYLLLYFVSLLAGSAGALLQSPNIPTVGASGAIFGLFGAMLVLEYFATGRIVGGQAFGLIAINLVLSFTISTVSWGGHIGGLVGGILGTLALAQFRRAHPGYARLGLVSVAGLLAVGVASVAVAYLKVHGQI